MQRTSGCVAGVSFGCARASSFGSPSPAAICVPSWCRQRSGRSRRQQQARCEQIIFVVSGCVYSWATASRCTTTFRSQTGVNLQALHSPTEIGNQRSVIISTSFSACTSSAFPRGRNKAATGEPLPQCLRLRALPLRGVRVLTSVVCSACAGDQLWRFDPRLNGTQGIWCASSSRPPEHVP